MPKEDERLHAIPRLHRRARIVQDGLFGRRLEVPDIPCTESLKDTVVRLLPVWRDEIAPTIRSGQRVLIAAHGNSLRALVKELDQMSDVDVADLNIPTGIPLVYELNDDLAPIRSFYLGDPGVATRAAEAVAAPTNG